MERVGQGYAESRRQLEQALKDARQTSTELALSALQSMRATSLGVHPRDAATAAAAIARGGSPDSGASNGVAVPHQLAATLAGATTTANARAAEGAAAASVSTPKDPTAPVPVLDDRGNPVLIPKGPYKGQQMLRPAGLDPHFFVKQGTADKSRYDALSHIANPYGGDAGLAMLLREFEQLYKFRQGGEWDAQRAGRKNYSEYVDYATVAIGLYAASAGISRDNILRLQDAYASRHSSFRRSTEKSGPDMDETYTHLPRRNVANTDLGFQLYQSGLIRAAAKP